MSHVYSYIAYCSSTYQGIKEYVAMDQFKLLIIFLILVVQFGACSEMKKKAASKII